MHGLERGEKAKQRVASDTGLDIGKEIVSQKQPTGLNALITKAPQDRR
jgi:hypothetical protein